VTAHIRHAALVELRRVRRIVKARLMIVTVGMIVVVIVSVVMAMCTAMLMTGVWLVLM
jgi:hypothetical protein